METGEQTAAKEGGDNKLNTMTSQVVIHMSQLNGKKNSLNTQLALSILNDSLK